MPDDQLRSHLLRIAADLPKGSPARRELLAALASPDKTGADLTEFVISAREWWELHRKMKADTQSQDLLQEILDHYRAKFAMTSNEEQALNRLRNGLDSVSRWDEATHRNNIFKVANLLGIKLPSGMF
jgi:hypothetical protein